MSDAPPPPPGDYPSTPPPPPPGGYGQPSPAPPPPPPMPSAYGAGGAAGGPVDVQGRPLAEWWKRAVAYVVDYVIVSIPLYIIFFVMIGVGTASMSTEPQFDAEGNLIALETTGGGMFGGSLMISMLLFLVAPIIYFVFLNGSEKGQTVGKMVMKLQTRDAETGGPAGYGKAAIRYIVAAALWALCAIPGIVDALFPLWDAKRETIHDKAAKTAVIDIG